jgi:hypothetical protein
MNHPRPLPTRTMASGLLFLVCSRRRPCYSERGSACNFCDQLRDIQESPEVAKVLNIVSNLHEEIPVKRAGADNTTKWSSFATRILKHAKVQVCSAHATGES